MYVYFTVLFICCIIFYATRNNQNPKGVLITVFSIIWCMIAFQEGWGGDYMSYVDHFNYFQGFTIRDALVDDSHGEAGYKIFMSLCPTYRISFWIGIGIYCAGLAFFFYQFVPRMWWPLMLFFLFVDRPMMMGAISSYPRMAIANAALFVGYYFLSKEKRLWFVVTIALACFFHKSIFFLLPFFFVKGEPIKYSLSSGMWFCAVIAVVSIATPESWVSFIERALSNVSDLEEYADYIDLSKTIDTKGLSLLFYFYWLFFLLRQLKETDLNEYEYIILKFALIRIIFDLLPAVGMSVRVFYYLDYAFFAGMLVILSRMDNKDANKWILLASLILMFFVLGYMTYYKDPFFVASWWKYHYIFGN